MLLRYFVKQSFFGIALLSEHAAFPFLCTSFVWFCCTPLIVFARFYTSIDSPLYSFSGIICEKYS